MLFGFFTRSEDIPNARETGKETKPANMADTTSLPRWPVIVNKSLEESDIHRLLGQNHKVKGNQNFRKMFWACLNYVLDNICKTCAFDPDFTIS